MIERHDDDFCYSSAAELNVSTRQALMLIDYLFTRT